MDRSIVKSAAVVAFIVMATLSLGAQGNPNQPAIDSAVVSADQTIVFVRGTNFGKKPTVTLNGQALTGVQVDSTGQQLFRVDAVARAGTAQLQVMNKNFLADLDVTITGVEPAGYSGSRGTRQGQRVRQDRRAGGSARRSRSPGTGGPNRT